MYEIKFHLPKSQYKRPIAYGKKTHITIHSTGNNNSTAYNELNNIHRLDNTEYVSWHYVVGEDVIYEVIPPEEVAYHAGNRVANWNSIGIEMVHTGDRDRVIKNTVDLVGRLMKKFNIPPENVVRHYDWKQVSKGGKTWYKNCPEILNYNNWEGWTMFKTLLRGDMAMTEEQIRQIVREEMRPSSKESNLGKWAYPDFVNLNARGIEVTEQRFNDVMTRGEVIALIAKLTEPNTLLNVIKHAEVNADEE